MDGNAIRTIALQEIKINIRNKWVLMFAVLFGGLSLAVCYFGLVTVGAVGVQSFTRTTASLLNLVLYLVPLLALVMATLSFSSEKGVMELLYSQPVGRGDILVGKLLGLFLCIVAATCVGFGLSGAVIASRAGSDGFTQYVILVGLALLLALIFLSLGSTLSILFENKAKALGTAVFLWFFLVVVYDLLAIGMTFLFKERTANVFIFLSLFGNPVDLVRVSGLISLGGVTILGAAGAALIKFLGGPVLSGFVIIASLLVWATAPLLFALRRLGRQDI